VRVYRLTFKGKKQAGGASLGEMKEAGLKKEEERFLSAQADTFAGANVKRKSVGVLRSK
jgi:hypothetical protein